MNRFPTLALAFVALMLAAPPLHADEVPWRFGTELDLLPFLSDGYSVSVVAGRGHFRGRLVRTELTTPDFVTDDDFRDDDLEIVALVFDYFPRDDQTGWWFGVGLELWDGEVTEKASGLSQTYQSTVLTGGAGYVWRFGEHFTVNPWAGIHAPIGGDRTLRFPSHEFSIEAKLEASLKVGLSF